ncbi:Flp family type IVb pilin [Neobacillus niacini]|uniref:Flp family type IVb pilin n=1 Tax=Neobacillus niacini TaxID=86668 RepID=UPI0021CB6EA7|nr:Flp family type IVb pilin [Neobacillus niacini]MCM3765805.1 Flp family type IVb pilin [Neobacillus niacini]
MLEKIKNLVVEEEGQALTEYGLIIGLIVVGCVALLATLGTKISGWFSEITTAIEKKQ